jgi:hypothetical protein
MDIVRWKAHLLFAPCDVHTAKRVIDTNAALFLTTGKSCQDGVLRFPCRLGHIFWFSRIMLDAEASRGNDLIVVCAGKDDNHLIATSALLLGSYFVLCKGESVDDVATCFTKGNSRMKDILETVRTYGSNLTVTDCWRALETANEIGWLDFTSPSVDFDRCIDMGEYLHYDKPANGGVHVVVPSELIVFRCPSDSMTGAPGDVRRPPAYYAEVLADFGVRLVLRCGGAPYDKKPFLAAGIDVDDFPILDPTSPHALAIAARCLTMLARGCSGAVALHHDDDAHGHEHAVRQLVASYLVSRHDFDPAAAAAWDRMVRAEHGPAAAAAAAAAAAVVFSVESDPTANADSDGPAAAHPIDGNSRVQQSVGQVVDALQLEPLSCHRRRGGRGAQAETAATARPRRSRSLTAACGPRAAVRARKAHGSAAGRGFPLM